MDCLLIFNVDFVVVMIGFDDTVSLYSIVQYGTSRKIEDTIEYIN